MPSVVVGGDGLRLQPHLDPELLAQPVAAARAGRGTAILGQLFLNSDDRPQRLAGLALQRQRMFGIDLEESKFAAPIVASVRHPACAGCRASRGVLLGCEFAPASAVRPLCQPGWYRGHTLCATA
jgi:hypothetical protein